MRHRTGMLALLVGLAGACASGLEVSARHDPAYDFSGLETYAWLPRKTSGDPRLDAERMESRVRETVDAELATRGFRRVEAEPDFLVGYHVVLSQRRTTESFDDTYEYEGVWDDEYNPRIWSEGRTYTREYTEGTLVLDIADAKSKHLVWRASAHTELSLKGDPDRESTKVKLREALQRMLDRFPPRAPGAGAP